MNKLIQSIFALSFVAACGGSFPAPDQRLTDAEAAARSARELGAESDPGAALSLKLANEEISRAKAAMADDDNERANSLLVRAQADAELAIAQTREKAARLRRQRAIDSSATQRTTNRAEGASR